ncbi:hypothetical protein GOP47_0017425 [Adiantum capillus-veneris]|uniref:Uncharacterized protein n=1 Tax=Adiantum capillus-veneris TaxID=13818 RepID=A0A9D4UFT8_ADICA|nr:hypothetical protein GOP47_0017425 [Adiantum capillus-veneris]
MIPARLHTPSPQLAFSESGLVKSWPVAWMRTSWPKRHLRLVVRGLHSDYSGANEDMQKLAQSLFMDEDIGAEHGEGFETFRPRGPLKVDVDYLNDRMREKGLQRFRYAMKPDEAFGLIYSWDNVLADTRALKLDAWRQLALEEGKILGDDKEALKHILSRGTENVLRKVLRWADANSSVDHFKARLAKIYYEKLSKVRAPREGLKEWLEALATAGVPCAVASSLDRFNLLAALQRMGLYKYFQLDRPPSKCVVFEDDPRGIAAAHNCSMKAVALIGSHPAYELTQADLAVSSFSELSVINLRRLFANKGAEFMDLQKQPAEKKPPKRRTATDTFF